METRIAVIGIIVENPESVEKLNAILHQYGNYILGRMGVPYREKNMSIISIFIDAPSDVISALSGKIGMLKDVSTKTIYSKTGGDK
ncbi:putative iron-only hydrogenase system regulator [Hathewaya proteolytica DSM 3090]|uniref:Putative iron-only hydrogenase system regulator n=1 Tax=Hathewaya proteolytica DSM 3090 TaxID=1121331 RepID=A0A1M6K3J6_9CLOT|nr:TM1266 family iron-only hydrogenase system putative regulator [Hathewaya proteolytica]SHJ53474.1 putative iron-only hydrogenase system regulator [Hathewaya proteolytica DSM 3090]